MIDDFDNYGIFDRTTLLNTDYEDYLKNDSELKIFLTTTGYKHIQRLYFKIPFTENKLNTNFTYNDLNISYEKFPWQSYLSLNDDLRNGGLANKDMAWNHWFHHGIKEERAFSYINNSNNHRGRLGNIFFINMFLHFISLKFNLKSNYKFASVFNDLGINLCCGENIYNTNLLITEKNFLDVLERPGKSCNIIIDNKVWFHNKIFSHMIKDYLYQESQKRSIINSNIFKDRYQNNNDLFIHLRLGDISNVTEKTYSYYKNILREIPFTRGYVSSDSIQNNLCIDLIKEFGLCAINKNEQETIMFGSTCKYVILSGGTFSWMIGLLSFFAEKIFYPKLNNVWYGTEIFEFSNWKGITLQ